MQKANISSFIHVDRNDKARSWRAHFEATIIDHQKRQALHK
jgi:hypothetical protein